MRDDPHPPPPLDARSPPTAADVAVFLAECHRSGRAVVTQGGRTGLVGGAEAPSDRPSVLLRTDRLVRLDPVDQATGQVTVGAGVTLAALHRHVAAAGWVYGVDLAARDSATVGGTVATNAGGIHVLRYGMTRAQVVGLEAVLATGEIIDDTRGLLKDNTGYDLSGLLVGSEGTLAVVTAARLRLHRPPSASSAALIPVASLADAVALTHHVARGCGAPVDLLAAEVIDAQGVRWWAQVHGAAPPLDPGGSPWLLLLDVADGGTAEGFAPLFEPGLPTTGPIGEPALAVDAGGVRRLWAVREGQSETYERVAAERGRVVHKADVSVPSGRLDDLVGTARERLASGVGPDAMLGVFGHVADGNLHLQVLAPADASRAIADALLTAAADLGGSISAEHGIGRDKVRYLHLRRSPTELRLMRAIKDAWDPGGILNPGVLLG